MQASFRFYGPLNYFLPLDRQQVRFQHRLKERASIKDTIEALGVPHPEVDLILVNGESVDFSYLLQDADDVSVYPLFTEIDIAALSRVRPAPLPDWRFVLDVHLGKLAIYLRLLGFDALYRNDYDDEPLAELSSQQQRILLTQDRALLKRSIVTYGYLVRSPHPQQQILEVLRRFDLFAAIAPLQRCLRCNGRLQSVPKQAVQDVLPALTRQYYEQFSRCQSCGRVYWQGAHYERIQQFIDRVRQHEDVPPDALYLPR